MTLNERKLLQALAISVAMTNDLRDTVGTLQDENKGLREAVDTLTDQMNSEYGTTVPLRGSTEPGKAPRDKIRVNYS